MVGDQLLNRCGANKISIPKESGLRSKHLPESVLEISDEWLRYREEYQENQVLSNKLEAIEYSVLNGELVVSYGVPQGTV